MKMKITTETIKRYRFEFPMRKEIETNKRAKEFVAFLVERMHWQQRLAEMRLQKFMQTDPKDVSNLSAERIFGEFLPIITFDLEHHHSTHFGIAFWIEVSDKESLMLNQIVQEFSRKHEVHLQLN
jgi:hypothetical protein